MGGRVDVGARTNQNPLRLLGLDNYWAILCWVKSFCETCTQFYLHAWAQDTCPNKHDADWAMCAYIGFPTVPAPIKNPNLYSQLNSRPTRNIVFDSVIEHVQYHELLAHVQTDWAWFQNKKYQT